MTKDELNDAYFTWACRLVYNARYSKKVSYTKLLRHLHSREFKYIIGMDGNRAEDGIGLRYRFGYEFGYPDSMIEEYLGDRECSIFEMLVALADRCENHIMSDPDIGDRTGLWFWDMICNLGLGDMSDSKFGIRKVDAIVDRFLDRLYERDGTGGLFTVKHPEHDMRTTEIWYQMMWYLNELSKK